MPARGSPFQPRIRGLLRACLWACLLGPGARAQSLFLSDLEEADEACFASRPSAGCGGWLGIRDAGVITLAKGETFHSGQKSLRIDFSKNEQYGGAFRTISTRHLFTRWYDYYDEGFDFGGGMKIHRISGFNAAASKNDFDIILQLKADEPNYNLCGLTESKHLDLTFNGGPIDWGTVGNRLMIKRGKWYAIETEIKLNTPGKSDGLVRVWVDGRLHAERKNFSIAGNVSSPINRVLFGGWYSSSLAGRNPCPDPVNLSRRFVDDPAISGSYIGPIPTVSAGPTPLSRVISVVLPEPGSMQIEYGPTAAYGAVLAAVTSPSGLYTLPITGLDTNRIYHYRLRGTLSGLGAYLSPDHVFSTAPGGLNPPRGTRPRSRPVNLKAKEYDPIPD